MAPNVFESWLDRHPRAPVWLLVLLAFAVHLPQWLLAAHSDPLWLIGNLVHGTHHGWLPGHNYLDPYIGFTTEALGRLVARDWLHGIVPWWNPYTGIGVPLAGQMQPSAFLLPFVLLLGLPGGVAWLTIAMQIVTGLGTLALLRELGLGRLAALTGAALFELNGTIAWVPGPGAVFCTLAFLPWLLWGIERARRPACGPQAILGVAAGIGGSLIAGFPETAYIDGLMGLAWAALRILGGPFGAIVARRVIGGGLLGLLLATPLLIAFADEMVGSKLIAEHGMGTATLRLQALPLVMMPSIYGPINAGTGADTLVWSAIGGYTGVLIVLLALLNVTGLRAMNDRPLVILLAAWVVLALAKTYGFQPLMVINALPGLQQVAWMRYADPSWELAFVILAAGALDRLPALLARRRPLAWSVALTLLAVSVSVAIACVAVGTGWSDLRPSRMFLLIGVATAWTLGLIAAAVMTARRNPDHARGAVALLVVGEAAAMFCLPQMVGEQGGKLDLGPVRFLQAHAGLSRVVTLGPLSPNYGAYFGFAMLNHNMSPVPQSWLDYLDVNLLPGIAEVEEGATFWPVLPPPHDPAGAADSLSVHLSQYRAMGVRYVASFKHISLLASLRTPPGTTSAVALPLLPGDTAVATIAVPVPGPLVSQVGVLLGTYGGQSNGDLRVQLCAASICRIGTAPLAGMADNGIGYVPIDPPLATGAAGILQLRITHAGGGTAPVALWITPRPAPLTHPVAPGSLGPALLLTAPGLAAPAELSAGIRTPAARTWRKVFSGVVMDIWELPDPLAYFDADSCVLEIHSRISLHAQCAHPAFLTRRELFTAGWTASVNGAAVAVTPTDTVLQQVSLPAGASDVRFDFTPPFMAYGYAALAAALFGIAWQIARLRRRHV